MKIVIIEDEKAAVRNLTSLLNEIKPNGEIVTILDSISSTIEWFSSHPMPELVFMDIHLADGPPSRYSTLSILLVRLSLQLPMMNMHYAHSK